MQPAAQPGMCRSASDSASSSPSVSGIASCLAGSGRVTDLASSGLRLISPSSTAAPNTDDTLPITFSFVESPSSMPAIHCWLVLGRRARSRIL